MAIFWVDFSCSVRVKAETKEEAEKMVYEKNWNSNDTQYLQIDTVEKIKGNPLDN